MSLMWLAGAGILALASCVFGLARFGLGLVALLGGALVGTPVGVWGLATLPASWLRRLIGLILMGVVLIE